MIKPKSTKKTNKENSLDMTNSDEEFIMSGADVKKVEGSKFRK